MKESFKREYILEDVLQGITDPLIILSRDYRILWANKAFLDQTGYTLETIIGNYCYKVSHHRENPCEPPNDLCPLSEALKIGGTAITTHTHFDKDGNKIFVEISAYPVKAEEGEIIHFVYTYKDITERKRQEVEISRLAKFPSENPNPVLRVAKDGTLLYANKASNALLNAWGYQVNKPLPDDWSKFTSEVYSSGFKKEVTVKVKDRTFSLTFTPIADEKYVNVYGLDVTERVRAEEALRKAREELEKKVQERTTELKRANVELLAEIAEHERTEEELRLEESRLEALLILNQMEQASIKEITDFVLEEGVRLTKSKLGFIGFMSEDEMVFTVHTWSKTAVTECTIIDKPIHFPISQAGLWVQAVVKRKPFIFNDYSATSLYKKGFPKGHVELSRILSIPLLDGNRIVALACVGNKNEDYNESDIRQMSLLLNGMWRHIQRKQAENALLRSEARLSEAQRIAHLGNWDWNIQTNELYWSDEIYRIFGLTPQEFGATYEAFLASVHPEDKDLVKKAVNEALNEKKPYGIDHRIVLPDGTMRLVYEQAEVTFDDNGRPIRMLGTVQDITDRKRAEEELRKSHEQLRDLSEYLQMVREEERIRIAREIHDELGQALTALKFDISLLANQLYPDHKPLIEKAAAMSKQIDETINTVKKICAELRPTILDHFGLSAAVEWQAEEFQNKTGIKCQVTLNPKDITLDQDLSTAIFRAFQETLTNVARHAEATHVKIDLKERDGILLLKVNDNGKGITKRQIFDTQSFGLLGIRERVHKWGGNVKIRGVQNKGTMVTISIPMRRDQ